MEGITVIKKPRLRRPTLLVAWPGMGDVAYRAANYLVDKLKAEEFARIEPENFFYLTGSIIDNGVLSAPELPFSKFYFWKNKKGKEDLIVFLSNAQPDLARAEEYSQKIISLAKAYKAKAVAGFAAIPVPIDHTHKAGVWLSSSSKEMNEELKKYGLNLLKEGQISGMNGLFLGRAKKDGLNGFCLLGEVPLYTIQIENPRASLAVLEAFCRIAGIEVDFTSLREQAQSMESEINKLLEYLKIGPQAPGPIGEEEIEKIKKSLSQLTKLPASIKEKIEQLFEESKANITKANELKTILDRWNAYKEYEDRFLDLFKKANDKSN